jgi:hypothetical protein
MGTYQLISRPVETVVSKWVWSIYGQKVFLSPKPVHLEVTLTPLIGIHITRNSIWRVTFHHHFQWRRLIRQKSNDRCIIQDSKERLDGSHLEGRVAQELVWQALEQVLE